MSDLRSKLVDLSVNFDADSHTYTGSSSGDEYISVTTLLQKFNLSPSDYSKIPEAILKNKASYGTAVHEALEAYIQGDDAQLIVPEVQAFKDWLDGAGIPRNECISEQVIFNQEYGIAGTADLQIWNMLADFKTTSSLYIVSVMWQLSLYNFLLHPNEVDYSTYELRVFWFNAKGNLTVKEIPLIPYNRLISMLDAYKNGESTWVDDTLPAGLTDKVDELIKQRKLIASVDTNLKQLKNDYDLIRMSIEEQMAAENRVYVVAPSATITLYDSSRTTYDSKKIDKLLDDLNLKKEEYVKVSEFTRMQIKEN